MDGSGLHILSNAKSPVTVQMVSFHPILKQISTPSIYEFDHLATKCATNEATSRASAGATE
jgi:hypothetical protein